MTNLIKERIKRKLKQYEVAADLRVTQTYIGHLEKGKEVPSNEFAKRLEEYFGKPISYLLSELD